MIIKLTAAPWKWKNGRVKEMCKKKKGKWFSHFPFPIQNKLKK